MLSPDGPFGPAFVIKPGALFIARKAKAVIIPCGAWTRQSFQLNRWDRYLVPFPLSHIAMVFREPIQLLTNPLNENQIEELLIRELHAARDTARNMVGETSSILNL
jgi:lysophospholipid acyltransferase (LPLAT)-like uncharacterized protein